jgi:hypothetical protein
LQLRLIFWLLTPLLALASDAEALFDQKCAARHIKTFPKDRSALVAPPVMGVMRHVKMAYPQKPEAIAFIVEYVMEPKREKATCMAQSIERFGLMPSQKESVTEAELEQIASWMFEHFPPKNFKGMQGMRDLHGH